MSDTEKSALRMQMKASLEAMDKTDHATWSENISRQLVEEVIPESARTVMVYLAHGMELNLDQAISRLLEQGLTIAVPEVSETENLMRPVQLATLSASALNVDRFGIRVPSKPHKVELPALDVVVVPGIAFDRSGARLGRGGGFYDRFLKSLPEGTMRVGACFSSQLLEQIPTDPHDLPVGLVVTEHGVYQSKN